MSESDAIHDFLRPVIWQRRRAFYTDAVAQGIVTPEQVDALLSLHSTWDDRQDQREAELAKAEETDWPAFAKDWLSGDDEKLRKHLPEFLQQDSGSEDYLRNKGDDA